MSIFFGGVGCSFSLLVHAGFMLTFDCCFILFFAPPFVWLCGCVVVWFAVAVFLLVAVLQALLGIAPDIYTTACVLWLVWQAPQSPGSLNAFPLASVREARGDLNESHSSINTSAIPPLR